MCEGRLERGAVSFVWRSSLQSVGETVQVNGWEEIALMSHKFLR